MMVCGRNMYRRRAYWRTHAMAGWPAQFPARLFGPGEVRLALLSLIGDKTAHGYELMKTLEERSGGIYRASAGTVYPTLQQLEDEGLITSDLQDGKRVYRTTDAGRRELEQEAEAVRRIWRRADRLHDWRSALHPDAAEVRGPAERLVKAAFRVVAGAGDESRVDRVRDILERALRDLEAEFGHKR